MIARPDQYVSVDLWTGTSATRTIETGTAPDFVWIKQRNNAGANMLFDSVRGATKRLVSNQTLAEGTVQGVTDFLSNGYQLGNDPDCNWTDNTHVGWSWKAGGNKNTFNVDDVGYANASDVSMDVGGIRAAVAVSSGNDYSAGYAGHSPVGTWVDSDSWSGLPAYSSGQKGYFSGTETLSNGSVISAAANPKPFNVDLPN